MKKQNLKEKEEKEVSNRMTWNSFRETKLDDINEILDLKDRVIIVSLKGDIYELRKMEF